jgi:hypothetical protein
MENIEPMARAAAPVPYLSSLPLLAAPAALPSNAKRSHGRPPRGRRESPIFRAPFVRVRQRGDRGYPNFWAVKPSGKYEADAELAGKYARMLLSIAVPRRDLSPFLGNIVLGMIKARAPQSMVLAFFHEIACAVHCGVPAPLDRRSVVAADDGALLDLGQQFGEVAAEYNRETVSYGKLDKAFYGPRHPKRPAVLTRRPADAKLLDPMWLYQQPLGETWFGPGRRPAGEAPAFYQQEEIERFRTWSSAYENPRSEGVPIPQLTARGRKRLSEIIAAWDRWTGKKRQLSAALGLDALSERLNGLSERTAELDAQIAAMRATTIEGLKLKARIVEWERRGHEYAADETDGVEMLVSIVRDLLPDGALPADRRGVNAAVRTRTGLIEA